jgi:hypothetical protein
LLFYLEIELDSPAANLVGFEHAPRNDEDETEQSHSDINGYYRIHCAKPEALNAIEVRLFEHFPATKSLEVQSIGPNGQGGDKLTADDPILSF